MKTLTFKELGFKTLKLNGITFFVQSFKKGDFVNLCSDSNIDAIRIDFVNKRITSWGKEDSNWKRFVQCINIIEIERLVNVIMKQ